MAVDRPKTIEEWDNLPEWSQFGQKIISLPDPRFPDARGETVTIPVMDERPICYHVLPDDPLRWIGKNGRIYRPVFTKKGWRKEEIC